MYGLRFSIMAAPAWGPTLCDAVDSTDDAVEDVQSICHKERRKIDLRGHCTVIVDGRQMGWSARLHVHIDSERA